MTGGTFERHHGGKGANQAVAAARLGASTIFVGLVGDDELGRDARAALAADGVDVAPLGTGSRTATGVAGILVDAAGENLIGVAPGANALLTAGDAASALVELGLTPDDVVLVSNEIPAEAVRAALAQGRAAGARTVLNPAPADGMDSAILALVDILTPNRTELSTLSGSDPTEDPTIAARALLGRAGTGIEGAVVVTLGSAGALVVRRDPSDDTEPRRVPAPVVSAVDTTGAGDAFNGSLAAALAAGRSLDEAVARAVTAGALATTRVGARSGMPTARELEAAFAR